MNLSTMNDVLNAQREATLKSMHLGSTQSVVATATRTPAIRSFSAPKEEKVPTLSIGPLRSAGTEGRPPTFAVNNAVYNSSTSTSRFVETQGTSKVASAASVAILTRDFKSLNKNLDQRDVFEDNDVIIKKREPPNTIKREVINVSKIQSKDTIVREKRRFRSCSNLSLLLEEEDEGVATENMPSKDAENSLSSPSSTSLQLENACLDGAQSMIKDLMLSKEKKRACLMQPYPQAYGLVKCYVKRNRSGANALFPEYSVFLQEDDLYLMSSKKRPNNTSSNYLIYMDQPGDALGKLRSNMSGSEYVIYDAGVRPEYLNDQSANKGNGVRAEHGAVLYQKEQQSNSSPRKIIVCLNALDKKGGDSRGHRPQTKAEEMITFLKHKTGTANTNFCVLENKMPQWSEQMQSYVLNFGGRVTMDSIKNFQLIHTDGVEQKVVLQFGRVAKDEFTMDFQWPLSPFLALALSLSSWGFESW